MPYITQERRNQPNLKRAVRALKVAILEGEITSRGDMNYVIFSMAKAYLGKKGMGYHNISDCVAAAQDCADEIKRIFMGPREDFARESKWGRGMKLSQSIKGLPFDDLLDGIENYHCFSKKININDLDYLADSVHQEEKDLAFLTLLVRELRSRLNTVGFGKEL